MLLAEMIAMFIGLTGMVCSVGMSAATSCAALRAGIAQFDELPYQDDRGEPIIGAAVAGLDPQVMGAERLVEMLALAVGDCLGNPAIATEPVPLLLGLAEPDRPGGCAGQASAIIAGLQAKLGRTFHRQLSRAIPQGHTAGFEALRLARDLLQDAQTPACLVCAADSYINAADLGWLEERWRLKTEDNSDGVIPGEAAAALLLTRAAAGGDEAGIAITGLGFAREEAHLMSDEPLLGLGLAAAVRAALLEAGLPMHEIDFRMSDLTGEAYGFKEQCLIISRLLRARREDFPLLHCADSIGDVGAAAGLVQLVVANEGIRKGYLPGPRALACTSSLAGSRAAAVVRGDLKSAARTAPMTMMPASRV